MKKIVFLLFALPLLGAAAHAQQKYGIKGGINFSSLWGNSPAVGSRTAVHMGAMADFVINEKYSFQPELIFSMQGAKTEISGIVYEERLDYIIIPLIAKYYLNNSPFCLEAGPQLGFLMSAKRGTEDMRDAYKSIDLGLTAGVGYELPYGLFFEARYCFGLLGIAEDYEYEGNSISAGTMGNSVIQLSMGYKL